MPILVLGLCIAWSASPEDDECLRSNSSALWTTATSTTPHTGEDTAIDSLPPQLLSSMMISPICGILSVHMVRHAGEISTSMSRGTQVKVLACRDLKLDNSLLDGQKPPFLKICDFGFASHFDAKLTEHLG